VAGFPLRQHLLAKEGDQVIKQGPNQHGGFCAIELFQTESFQTKILLGFFNDVLVSRSQPISAPDLFRRLLTGSYISSQPILPPLSILFIERKLAARRRIFSGDLPLPHHHITTGPLPFGILMLN
jgi:hypothetical protein